MKSKLEIYALSVCFAAVVCLIISLGIGSYSIVKISSPQLTMNAYNYDQYQTNNSYWKKNKPYCKDECENKKPEESDLTKQRIESFKVALEGESRRGFQSLIQCSLFILFSSIALLIHWQIAKKSRNDSDV